MRETHLDGLRRLLLREPRGHPSLCAVLVLPPLTHGADVGIIILEQGGFRPMSGSNTMCAVTALLETGSLPVQEPETVVLIDTAVGLVEATAFIQAGRVRSVRVRNVASFVEVLDQPIDVPEYGTVHADIACGGQSFVQGPRRRQGADRNARGVGAQQRRTARRPHHRRRSGIMAGHPGPVTGTSARMAVLHKRGELDLHEPFVHEGVLGTTFRGLLHVRTTVGGCGAVVPPIEGRAWITAYVQHVLHADDPFPTGLTVGDVWSTVRD